MPVYIFHCEGCGAHSEETRPMSDSQKPKVCDCGETMIRDFAAEHGGVIATPGNWPMESYAVGVNPAQVPEFMKFDQEHGVKTEYSRGGNPIFTDRAHRKRYCDAHGKVDRNAGFGDPQGT
jgi:putative FmdB family regulatory protein